VTPPPLAATLGLEPHPEGGWYRRTWATAHTATPDGYPGPRPTATAILFVLGPGEESRWHRVRSDELWCHQRGPALSLELGGTGARPGAPTEVVLGGGVENGEQPQALVPGGVWQRARPREEAQTESLVTCVVSPGFDFADFTLAEEPAENPSSDHGDHC